MVFNQKNGKDSSKEHLTDKYLEKLIYLANPRQEEASNLSRCPESWTFSNNNLLLIIDYLKSFYNGYSVICFTC